MHQCLSKSLTLNKIEDSVRSAINGAKRATQVPPSLDAGPHHRRVIAASSPRYRRVIAASSPRRRRVIAASSLVVHREVQGELLDEAAVQGKSHERFLHRDGREGGMSVAGMACDVAVT